jgi:hypothetical protein
MIRLDVATGQVLQGVDLLQIYSTDTFVIGLDGEFKLAPKIGTQVLEFIVTEDYYYLLYEDDDKMQLEGFN